VTVGTVARENFIVRNPARARDGHAAVLRGAWAGVQGRHGDGEQRDIKQAVMAAWCELHFASHIDLEIQTRRLIVLDVRGTPVIRQWHVAHLAKKRLSRRDRLQEVRARARPRAAPGARSRIPVTATPDVWDRERPTCRTRSPAASSRPAACAGTFSSRQRRGPAPHPRHRRIDPLLAQGHAAAGAALQRARSGSAGNGFSDSAPAARMSIAGMGDCSPRCCARSRSR